MGLQNMSQFKGLLNFLIIFDNKLTIAVVAREL